MSYQLTIEPTGQAIEVDDGQTILDAALRAGIWLPHACCHGLCATCKVQVRDGEIEHGDASPFALMDFERDEGKTLACCATLQSDVTIEADVEEDPDAEVIPVRDFEGTVTCIESLTPTIKGIWIQLPEAIHFQAGQYVNVHLRELGLSRPFSIACAPDAGNEIELNVRIVPGGAGTGYLHEKLAVGDAVRVSGPYGRFFVRKSAQVPVLFMAGGSGLSSPRSMILDLVGTGACPPITLVYGQRTRDELYYHDEFQRLAAKNPNFTYVPALSNEPADSDWSGFRGLVHDAAKAHFANDFRGHKAYLCGPPMMIDACITTLMQGRLFERDIYTEKFLSAADAQQVRSPPFQKDLMAHVGNETMETKLFRHFIDGAFVESRKTFEKRRPTDHALIGHVCEGGREEVDAAVKAARAAMKGPWGRMPVEQRAELLYKVADEITRRFDDFVAAEMADTGQPKTMMEHAFIPRGAANFKIFADVVKNVATETFMTPTPDGAGALNYAIRKPKGVIGVVCPWNAPLLLMTWKVGPALACGNTVVVKPSEETPGTATLLGEVMNAVGIPKGVYNVVHGLGPGSAGEHLTRHDGVAAITFTGETRTGSAIMKAAADGIRDVSFELGGKNAGVIFADCDFDAAIDGILRAAFLNCGQICLGTERLYVERPIFERFVAALKAKAEALKPGAPEDKATTLGPLISQEHRRKVLSYYEKAKAEGARIVTGGGVPELPGALAQGAWVQPTIWTGLPETASVIREEIFGPCCHIAPFDREDEVIEKVNDTAYGLSTTIWTRDLSRAHRVAAAIDVGITWVNAWFLRDLRTPFGGSKQSGIGREGGVHSLEFYTELRNICLKL